MYDFSKFSARQLFKELKYQRQFAGVKGVSYHLSYCKCLAFEIRRRGRS